MDERVLIVNADDYGLTPAISRGILRAHRDGVVTSTSVLGVGPAVGETSAWLGDHPNLAVGAHLALVGEDPPLLTAREVPTLVDRRGRFPLTWRTFLARAATGRVDPADVRREFDAQMALLVEGLSLRVGHLDTHQHLHLWPGVAEVVVAVARDWGVPAVRLPTSHSTGLRGRGIRLLARRLRASVDAAGLTGPAGYDGLDDAGHLVLPRLLGVLADRAGDAPGSLEINCHPGEDDPRTRERYAWDFAWAGELAALTDPALRAAITHHGFRTGSYADLAATDR